MMQRSVWTRGAALLAGLLVLCTLTPLFQRVSHAAPPRLDEIRVALFIQARGSVPAVTLSSPNGLKLDERTPAGVHPWTNAPSTARFALDQPIVELLRTANYNSAAQLHATLGASGESAFIFVRPSASGATEYIVAAGPYAGMEEASAAGSRLGKLSGGSVKIVGPHYWNAGTYSRFADAEGMAGALSDAGLDAWPVMQLADGQNVVYSVWIGGAADKAALEAVKAAALRAMPQLNLTAVDMTAPYLIVRRDVSDGKTAAVPTYSLNVSGQKLLVSPAQGPIQVRERSGRSYRGVMELTQHNGRLAVINVLPFEEYLYSVVGAEMFAGWPDEALKAQAVAARSFALAQGMKYGIAHISDTTYDQAYHGVGSEHPNAIGAVDATRGEVLTDASGNVVPALYYSNAGGMTADPSEVWGNPYPYAKSVPSPDQNAQENKPDWNRVVLPDGTVGYIRSDYTAETGQTNPAGLPLVRVTDTNVNVRPAPYVDNVRNAPIAKVNTGDVLVRIGTDAESNPFSWIYGPYSAEELLASINAGAVSSISGPLKTLEVTKRGPSGRVTEMAANGTVIRVSSPDAYRSVMKGVPSTRFEVENMADLTVIGASGKTVRFTDSSTAGLYAIGAASGAQPVSMFPAETEYRFAMDGSGDIRVISREARFRLIGRGFGHGLGMSQYGARELAEFLGYDYVEILKYYFQNVSIVNIYDAQ